jgi:hypothetical protein
MSKARQLTDYRKEQLKRSVNLNSLHDLGNFIQHGDVIPSDSDIKSHKATRIF